MSQWIPERREELRRDLAALKAVEVEANRSIMEMSIRSGRLFPPIALPPEMYEQGLRGAIVGAPAVEE
jgi:hypothetical protein